MPPGAPPRVLPLRPLTTAEVLDAAVSLLRAYGLVLLPVGLLLAVAEQVALAPLRDLAVAEPPLYLPDWDESGTAYWLLLAAGAGTETTIIALLGGLSARGVAADLLGTRLTSWRLLDPRGARFGRVLLIAVVAGAVTFLAALFGPLWAVGYALVGLAVPALVVDRVGVGRALSRGAALACRAGLRAGFVRVLGYLTWLAVRLVLGLGGIALLGQADVDGGWAAYLGVLVWLAVNTVAYPTLACVDAALHVETRMRTEGLDIWLARAAHHHRLDAGTLAVHR